LNDDGAGVERSVVFDGRFVAGGSLHGRDEKHVVIFPARSDVNGVLDDADNLKISSGIRIAAPKVAADGICARREKCLHEVFVDHGDVVSARNILDADPTPHDNLGADRVEIFGVGSDERR